MDMWVCWHFSSMISKQFSFVNGQHKMLNRRQKTMNLLCFLYLLFDSALEKKHLESSIDRLLLTINSPAEFFIAKKCEDFLFCYLLVIMKPQRSIKVLRESKHFPEIRFFHFEVCESIAFIDHVSDDDLRKNFPLATLRSETKPFHAHFIEVNLKRFGVFSFREFEFGLHSMTKYKHNEQITRTGQSDTLNQWRSDKYLQKRFFPNFFLTNLCNARHFCLPLSACVNNNGPK